MRSALYTFFLLAAAALNAQAQGFYSTGYGNVYGTYGLAMATQNIYTTMQLQMRRTMARNAMIAKWGLAAVEKAEREAAAKNGSPSSARTAQSSTSSASKIVVPPAPVVRNYGVFRPDPSVDTGRSIADALGDTPEEKALLRKIFTTTKAAYEQEAAAKGWKNNVAGGLTFFTVAAMTVYRDSAEPSDEAVDTFFKVVNQSVDQIPEFANVSNQDKQSFNNLMIAFGGIVLAGYTEGKQKNDLRTVKTYGQVAGALIKLVLRIEPDRLQIKNGMIAIE